MEQPQYSILTYSGLHPDKNSKGEVGEEQMTFSASRPESTETTHYDGTTASSQFRVAATETGAGAVSCVLLLTLRLRLSYWRCHHRPTTHHQAWLLATISINLAALQLLFCYVRVYSIFCRGLVILQKGSNSYKHNFFGRRCRLV